MTETKDKKSRTPKLCHHKSKALYYLRLRGQTIYLGPNEQAAKQKYHLLLAGATSPAAPPQDAITIGEMFLAYDDFCEGYYRLSPKRLQAIRGAVKPFINLFSSEPAATFGPVRLRAYREMLVQNALPPMVDPAKPDAKPKKPIKLSRGTISKYVHVIVGAFKWGAAQELIPASVPDALRMLEPLKRGRTSAKETEPVKPVLKDHVWAVLPFLTRPVGGLVELCWWSGCRIGELCSLKGADIDQTGAIWIYKPTAHKTAHHGHERVICFGPEAQKVIKRFLDRRGPFVPLFSPWDAKLEIHERAVTPRRDNQLPNVTKTDRTLNDFYDPNHISKAIKRGLLECNKKRVSDGLKEIPLWHVHQIRHSFASRARSSFGIDAASVSLGHRDAGITLTYAEADLAKAAMVAAKLG